MSAPRPHIALIHWGAWGDLFVASASLKDVVDEFAGEPIYIVGSDKWLQIINPNDWPSIKGILTTDNGRDGELYTPTREAKTRSANWTKQEDISTFKFFGTVKASFNLRTESFRFAWAPWLARVPRRHGSAPLPWSHLFYTHRAAWLGKDPVIHERDRMLQVVETDRRLGQLARKWNQSTGLPQLKTPDRQNAETIAQAPFGKYWLINPTASRREKAWPPEKFRELATHLLPILKEKGLKLKIIGAAHETEWLKEAVPLSETSGMVIQTKAIGDLQDVLAGAQVLITNTSSMQFLAPGQKVRTMTLMGRSDPAIWGPLGPRDTVIRAQNLESTSRDLFEKEAAAYRSIEVERVLKECKRFLNEAEK